MKRVFTALSCSRTCEDRASYAKASSPPGPVARPDDALQQPQALRSLQRIARAPTATACQKGRRLSPRDLRTAPPKECKPYTQRNLTRRETRREGAFPAAHRPWKLAPMK